MNIPAITAAKLSPLGAPHPLTAPAGLASSPTGGRHAKPSAADIKKAASQFEAIILRQLLAPSIEPMMNGGPSASSGGGIYGYMLTDTLANSLSSAGGLGLSRMLEKQFSQTAPKASAAKPSSST